MAREQSRVREADQPTRPTEGSVYERQYAGRNAVIRRQLRGRILVKKSETLLDDGRQGLASYYLSPHLFEDTAFQDWFVFVHHIRVHSGKHIHQGGICLFVLQGKGYTDVEGARLEWSEGDLILLPTRPGGLEHQHFNAEPGSVCEWLAFIYLPQQDQLASGIKQVESSVEYQRLAGGAGGPDLQADYDPRRDFAGWPTDSFGAEPRVVHGFNGYTDLIRLRNEERARVEASTFVVRGAEIPWEVNPQGVMQWYMHPSLRDRCTRSYLFYRQRIAPDSRSGRQRHQGGQIVYFVEGRGSTFLDGMRYDWEAGDLLQLPLRPDGVIFQHVNGDPDHPAVLVACEPNSVDALGVDRGSGFVQLENCPEYDA